MKRRTLTAALAAVAVAGLALAGCSSNSGSSGGSGGTVSYMTWEANDTNAALDASFKKFEKSSGITVDRQEAPNADYTQKLASLLLAKKAPDYFWCSTTQEQDSTKSPVLT